tara:strand:- start:19 stop:870 length:852 start_codon:yes stop_codon:yes gene_type:complete
MSIHESVTKLLASGVASANRYEAIFTGRPLGGRDTRALNEHSKFLISSATMPGRSFTTGQTRGDQGLGVERKYVTGVMFNEFTLTYTLTGDMRVHQIFNEWAEICAPRASGHHSARRDIRVAYYNDYIDPKITLKKMERNGHVSMVTNIYNAYPIMVADLSLGSGQNNSALEFSVQFAYETFDNIYGGLSNEQISGGWGGFSNAVTDMSWAIGKNPISLSMFKDKQTADNVKTNYEETLGAKQAQEQRAAMGGSGDDGSGSDTYNNGSGGSDEVTDEILSHFS